MAVLDDLRTGCYAGIIPGTLASIWRYLCLQFFKWISSNDLYLYSLKLLISHVLGLVAPPWLNSELLIFKSPKSLTPTSCTFSLLTCLLLEVLKVFCWMIRLVLGLLCTDSIFSQGEGAQHFLSGTCSPSLEQKTAHLEGCLLLTKQHARRYWNQQSRKDLDKGINLSSIWKLVSMTLSILVFWKYFLLFIQLFKVRKIHLILHNYKAVHYVSMRRQILRMCPKPGKLDGRWWLPCV